METTNTQISEDGQELARRLTNFYRNSFVIGSGVTREKNRDASMSIWNNGTHGEPRDRIRMDFVEGIFIDENGKFGVGVLGWAWLFVKGARSGPDKWVLASPGRASTIIPGPELDIVSSYQNPLMSDKEWEVSSQQSPAIIRRILNEMTMHHDQTTGSSPALPHAIEINLTCAIPARQP